MTISQHFEKGFVYTWNSPGAIANQAKDGTIVASGNAAPPALTFTGVHALPGAVLNPRINQGRLIPYHWLDYILGRTAYVAAPGTDVLTGFMSGCWICSWTEGGQRRVGHVGTIDGVPPNVAPNTTVKNAFLASNALLPAANVRGYSPAAAWTPGEMSASFAGSQAVLGVKVLSLVTTNDHFYSILMLMLKGPNGGISNKWVCGGKKRVHSSTRNGIQRAMA